MKPVKQANLFFGSFGTDHTFSGYIQPIQAGSSEQAHGAMMSTYGNRWSIIYSGEDDLGILLHYPRLPMIYVTDHGTDDYPKLEIKAEGGEF